MLPHQSSGRTLLGRIGARIPRTLSSKMILYERDLLVRSSDTANALFRFLKIVDSDTGKAFLHLKL